MLEGQAERVCVHSICGAKVAGLGPLVGWLIGFWQFVVESALLSPAYIGSVPPRPVYVDTPRFSRLRASQTRLRTFLFHPASGYPLAFSCRLLAAARFHRPWSAPRPL